jgi:amidase
MTNREICFSPARALARMIRDRTVSVHEVMEAQRDRIKETLIWNAEQGQRLSGPGLGRIEIKRTRLYHRVREFMETYEFMILPVNQVPPFDVKERWVKEINDVQMETYIDWMKS